MNARRKLTYLLGIFDLVLIAYLTWQVTQLL